MHDLQKKKNSITAARTAWLDPVCVLVTVSIKLILLEVLRNGPFRKLSRAMLVTSFTGQCR